MKIIKSNNKIISKNGKLLYVKDDINDLIKSLNTSVWLAADGAIKLEPYTLNNSIDELLDMSGNEYDFYSSYNKKPQIFYDGVGGKPRIYFDGDGEIQNNDLEFSHPLTITMAFKPHNIGDIYGYWGNKYSDENNLLSDASNDDKYVIEGSNHYETNLLVNEDQVEIITVVFDGNDCKIYGTDGVVKDTFTSTNLDLFGFFIGRTNWGHPSQFDMYEFIMFNSVLDANDINTLYTYMNRHL